ncbi:MAG: DNA primase noncatalytic subunit PriX, partial [Candidatus Marsarchaeota archaeon]|nr:DNA primase noncatalytic subunit PriX [Candidatus Marsarchaeota archaeon]
YLNLGKMRVEEALGNGTVAYQNIEYEPIKKDFVISYVFARIIVSALRSRHFIDDYASAEAKRCIDAMGSESGDGIIRLSREAGINASLEVHDNQEFFAIKFADFLGSSSSLDLVNLKLHKGMVFLERYNFLKFFEGPARNAIKKNLPIKQADIPAQAFKIARQIKVQPRETREEKTAPGQYAWIEKLLRVPIPDVRHRIVNLILAPYFVTVRKFSEEKAFMLISGYIEKCKELEGNTKINDAYIRYQCRYAKGKKMRPLAFEKSKDLLKDVIDLDELA